MVLIFFFSPNYYSLKMVTFVEFCIRPNLNKAIKIIRSHTLTIAVWQESPYYIQFAD